MAQTKEALHDYARELGVAGVSNSIADFGDEPFDTIVDFVGNGPTTAAAVELVKRYGRVVLVGLAGSETTINTVDFMEQVAIPLPIRVIAEILGVDISHEAEMKRWSDAYVSLSGHRATDEQLAEQARQHVLRRRSSWST